MRRLHMLSMYIHSSIADSPSCCSDCRHSGPSASSASSTSSSTNSSRNGFTSRNYLILTRIHQIWPDMQLRSWFKSLNFANEYPTGGQQHKQQQRRQCQQWRRGVRGRWRREEPRRLHQRGPCRLRVLGVLGPLGTPGSLGPLRS